MAELVDAPDLGSGAERRGGSSPSWGTKAENMKLLQLAENTQSTRNPFAIDFTKLSKNDICQILENSGKEDSSLLSAYSFEGYDAFEFSSQIEAVRSTGKKDFRKIGDDLNSYQITVRNSKGQLMEHTIAIVLGSRFIYAEIFDGVELKNEGTAADIRKLSAEIERVAPTDPKKAAELLDQLDSDIQDAAVTRPNISSSWLEDTHYAIQNLIDSLDDGDHWESLKNDWEELLTSIKKRVRD